ncbi:hypothetical protein HMPREF3232_00049 [Fannyhessea vaginae]|nr:hypothetical protein HMPREF3232_00049 [Fannyhessea vaginae]
MRTFVVLLSTNFSEKLTDLLLICRDFVLISFLTWEFLKKACNFLRLLTNCMLA